jgi:hypothetical protein
MTESELADIEADLAARMECVYCGGTGYAGGPYGGASERCPQCKGACESPVAAIARKLLAEVRVLNRLLGERLELDTPGAKLLAERARAEERERVCRYLDEQAELLRRSGYHLQADATRDHAAWIRADRYAETPVRAVTDG